MVCLRPEGMLFFTARLLLLYLSNSIFFFFFVVARQAFLTKFFLDRVQRARSFADRTFHCLVTLHRLASWGLGPKPAK